MLRIRIRIDWLDSYTQNPGDPPPHHRKGVNQMLTGLKYNPKATTN